MINKSYFKNILVPVDGLRFSFQNEEVAGKIPFNSLVTEVMVLGKPIAEHSPESTVSKKIKEVFRKITKINCW